jgi:AcrR family transcriptional regulator
MSLAVEEEARIFAAARRLAEGGASFTMHELARAAGMSRATLYRRVRGREQLARRLAARGVEAPPSTRERALAAGRALIVEQGVAGLTVEAIAARAGVAATTVYREFGERQALLRAVFKSVIPIDTLRPLLADHERPPELVLREFAAAMLAHLRVHPTMLRIALLRGAEEVVQLRRLRRAEESMSTALMAYIAAQIDRGRLRAVGADRMTASLIGLVLGAHMFHVLHPGELRTPAAVADEMIDLLLHGVAVRAGGARRSSR